MIANIRAAIIQYLLTQENITDICQTRIDAEIPATDASPVIAPIVVVSEAGGSRKAGGYTKWHSATIEIWTYARSPSEASDLFGVIRASLKNMRRNIKAETLLHGADITSGAVSGRDALSLIHI